MTDEDIKKMKKYTEILNKIVDGVITKEDAISEYMQLGDSYKDAEGAYFEVISDINKSKNNWL